jgi:hypothetical protein
MSQWTYILPIEKATGSTSENDEWIITGVVTGPDFVDAEDMEVTESAINKLVERINEDNPVPLKDWHAKNTIMAEMGEVFRAFRNDSGELSIDARLDKSHPTSKWLMDKLDKGKKFGFSLQGRADHKLVEKAGKKVIQLLDILPGEVSLTTKPFYQPSFGTVIKKAIDEADAESVEKGEQSSMETEVTPKAEAETPAPTPDVPAPSEPSDTPDAPTPSTPSDSGQPASDAGTGEVAKSEITTNMLGDLVALLVPAIRAELASSSTDSTAPTADQKPVETTSVEKSEDDRLLELEKALKDTREELERIKENTPGDNEPGVLVQKSDEDELMEVIKAMDASQRLRFGLQVLHRDDESR